MLKTDKKSPQEVNSGSMADIAFLLLIFFMITTTIVNDQGLDLLLPPHREEQVPIVEINERNLFNIRVNSNDKIMVEGEVRSSYKGLRKEVKDFVMNYGRNPDLSESPTEAVVSIKTNRGTSQYIFIKVLDEVKAAYYQIYAERAGISAQSFLKLKLSDPNDKKIYEQTKQGIPMNISIAEPDR